MSCDQIRDKFADYLTGDLDAGARDQVQGHIAACAACRAEIEDLTAVWAKLGVLPVETPTGALRQRFYDMLAEYKSGLGKTADNALRASPVRRWREWLTFRRPAFAASFSVALLLMGLGLGWAVSGGRATSARLAALRSEVQDMKQTVALSLLDQSSATDRLQGISYSTEVRNPRPKTLEALVETLDTDSNPNVRLAAVEALYLFRNQPGIKDSLVRSLAIQDSPIVQVALIDLLVEIRDERAAAALEALIKSDKINPDVKKLAEQGIRQLTQKG
jgi:hypothetical protein